MSIARAWKDLGRVTSLVLIFTAGLTDCGRQSESMTSSSAQSSQTMSFPALAAITPALLAAPSPSPSPAFQLTATLGTVSYDPNAWSQLQTILQAQCISCHGTSGMGGVSNITNLQDLVASGVIVPGNAANSLLYMGVASGGMPPTSNPNPNVQMYYDFIESGMSASAEAPAQ